MTKKKVAVAVSGGVDSGVAAALLLKQGYDCIAFHLRLWQEELPSRELPIVNFENKCCSTESLEAARKTAHLLGMPFYTLDLADFFKKEVVDYFLKAYGAGLTPNPCVVCNQRIKFGRLFDYVLGLGYDYLATGHYARISPPRCAAGATPPRRCLLTAKDKTKDQTYFLYNLTQKHLARVLFPVGEYQKKEVWQMAKNWRLPVAQRPESQEICFFPEDDYRPFLSRQIPQKIKPGQVVDLKGKVIGRHSGLPLYTIGQRHGFEINSKAKGQKVKLIAPFYVVGKKIKSNQLVVGFGQETETKEFMVERVSLVSPVKSVKELTSCGLRVRVRHQGELLRAKIAVRTPRIGSERPLRGEGEKVRVVLKEAVRGVAPGQSAVFYVSYEARHGRAERGSFEVLGGGIIAVDKT